MTVLCYNFTLSDLEGWFNPDFEFLNANFYNLLVACMCIMFKCCQHIGKRKSMNSKHPKLWKYIVINLSNRTKAFVARRKKISQSLNIINLTAKSKKCLKTSGKDSLLAVWSAPPCWVFGSTPTSVSAHPSAPALTPAPATVLLSRGCTTFTTCTDTLAAAAARKRTIARSWTCRSWIKMTDDSWQEYWGDYWWIT